MLEACFPYHEIPHPWPTPHMMYRPACQANLSVPGVEPFRSKVLLDTGADSCLFPLTFAKLLQLDISAMPSRKTKGVGSVLTVHYSTLTIDLGQGIRVDNISVGFTKDLDELGFGLLGQQGFFEHYDVHFSHKHRVFIIKTPAIT